MCICVDDIGMSEPINRAALELVRMGRVHALSCMVGGPAWPGTIGQLRALAPAQVDIGLHLDLTEFALWPGSRRSLRRWIVAGSLGRVDRTALRREIGAQLTAFEDGLGRAPSHVDGHQHVHQLAGIRAELVDALHDRYGQMPPWLRSGRAAPGQRLRSLKANVIERLGSTALEHMAERVGVGHNAHLLGVYDFRGGAGRYRRLLDGWLAGAAQGDLLMCHPALGARLVDDFAKARQAEFEVLSGAALADGIKAHGIELRSMTSILRLAAHNR